MEEAVPNANGANNATIFIPIAQLSPNLSTPASIKAIIALIWPFSSKTNSTACLFAEPNFRLRREGGQVRVQFSGSSAKAVADQGIGTGDEVSLSLEGGEWIEKESTTRIPGRSIEWELRYSERLLMEIRSEDNQAVTIIDIDHPTPVAEPAPTNEPTIEPLITESHVSEPPPTPLPKSRKVSDLEAENPGEWESPAFIKRARTSYGSLYGSSDIFAEVGAVKGKGRRKSKLGWRYTSRSPSPTPSIEAADESMVDESSGNLLPQTPPAMTDEGCQTMGDGEALVGLPQSGLDILDEAPNSQYPGSAPYNEADAMGNGSTLFGSMNHDGFPDTSAGFIDGLQRNTLRMADGDEFDYGNWHQSDMAANDDLPEQVSPDQPLEYPSPTQNGMQDLEQYSQDNPYYGVEDDSRVHQNVDNILSMDPPNADQNGSRRPSTSSHGSRHSSTRQSPIRQRTQSFDNVWDLTGTSEQGDDADDEVEDENGLGEEDSDDQDGNGSDAENKEPDVDRYYDMQDLPEGQVYSDSDEEEFDSNEDDEEEEEDDDQYDEEDEPHARPMNNGEIIDLISSDEEDGGGDVQVDRNPSMVETESQIPGLGSISGGDSDESEEGSGESSDGDDEDVDQMVMHEEPEQASRVSESRELPFKDSEPEDGDRVMRDEPEQASRVPESREQPSRDSEPEDDNPVNDPMVMHDEPERVSRLSTSREQPSRDSQPEDDDSVDMVEYPDLEGVTRVSESREQPSRASEPEDENSVDNQKVEPPNASESGHDNLVDDQKVEDEDLEGVARASELGHGNLVDDQKVDEDPEEPPNASESRHDNLVGEGNFAQTLHMRRSPEKSPFSPRKQNYSSFDGASDSREEEVVKPHTVKLSPSRKVTDDQQSQLAKATSSPKSRGSSPKVSDSSTNAADVVADQRDLSPMQAVKAQILEILAAKDTPEQSPSLSEQQEVDTAENVQSESLAAEEDDVDMIEIQITTEQEAVVTNNAISGELPDTSDDIDMIEITTAQEAAVTTTTSPAKLPDTTNDTEMSEAPLYPTLPVDAVDGSGKSADSEDPSISVEERSNNEQLPTPENTQMTSLTSTALTEATQSSLNNTQVTEVTSFTESFKEDKQDEAVASSFAKDSAAVHNESTSVSSGQMEAMVRVTVESDLNGGVGKKTTTSKTKRVEMTIDANLTPDPQSQSLPVTPRRSQRQASKALNSSKPLTTLQKASPMPNGSLSPSGYDASAELALDSYNSPTKDDSKTGPENDLEPSSSQVSTASTTAVPIELKMSLRTDRGEYTVLKQNRFKQSRQTDILAIATTPSKNVSQSKKPPRDWLTDFNITDASVTPSVVTRVTVFRPHLAALPIIDAGDGLLLRNFKVQPMQGTKFSLRSEGDSAWVVFKADGSVQVNGPPVEYGEEEVAHVGRLREWFAGMSGAQREVLERAHGKVEKGKGVQSGK